MVEIVSEPSPTKNWGESSDTQALHAHFCPNFRPIYHTKLEIEESEHHRAVGDALNALRVLQAIGSRAGKYPPPADMPYHQRYYGD